MLYICSANEPLLHNDNKNTIFMPLIAGLGMLIHTKSRRTQKQD